MDTNKKIIRGLSPDSEILDNLARDFNDILDEGKLKVCNFQESAGKTGLSVFNRRIRHECQGGVPNYEHAIIAFNLGCTGLFIIIPLPIIRVP